MKFTTVQDFIKHWLTEREDCLYFLFSKFEFLFNSYEIEPDKYILRITMVYDGKYTKETKLTYEQIDSFVDKMAVMSYIVNDMIESVGSERKTNFIDSYGEP